MPFRRRKLRRLPVCLVVAILLMVVATLSLAAIHTIVQRVRNEHPELTPRAHLPLATRVTDPGDLIVNGDFEQGEFGWNQSTSGENPKEHELIGSAAEGYNPYEGDYGARLGGYEGTWDVLTQTVTIPAEGQLSYWWQMHTHETEFFHDYFSVDLLALDGERLAGLASHGIQGTQGVWQQEAVDVSDYAGQTLVLRFHAYNDNYYFSWFDLDLVSLRPTP